MHNKPAALAANQIRRDVTMAKRGMMSESLKQLIADELGVSEQVAREGWGSISSRDCGRIVQKAIEIAERSVTSM